MGAPVKGDRPPMLLSRKSLAAELDMSESTVDEMVRRGVLPPPMHLSPGCVRWSWMAVEAALALRAPAGNDRPLSPEAEGVRRAIEASKERGRGRAA